MHIGFAVMRSPDEGEIDAEQRAIFESHAAEARSAPRTQLDLEIQGALLVAGAMEALSLPAFVCDHRGKIKAMSPRAETLVSAGGMLRLKEGKLGAVDAFESSELSDAIACVASGLSKADAPVTRGVLLHNADGNQFVAEVIPLPVRAHSFVFEPRAIVVIRGTPGESSRIKRLLQSIYKLTEAEADVAIRLAVGVAPEMIAGDRKVSIGTVRVQIRSIFSKLSVRRISELTAKLNQHL